MPNHSDYDYDVLIIGSGIAGLTLALQLANDAKIGLISKVELFNSSSQYAQGGIAAVTESKDFASHINDTLIAGAGLCDIDTVEFTVSKAPFAIQWLMQQGVQFTRDPNNANDFHLTREGGHSERRIYHVSDSTGAAVIKTLAYRVLEHPNIHCLTYHIALELLVRDQHCYGALVADKITDSTQLLRARNTVLATGGASTAYFYTSNPESSAGDGLSMAWNAGCRIANLEFNQFHPTSLFHPDANSFLISEAVRGEGGLLCLPNGNQFMRDYDQRLELAPRDIVARAMTIEMQRHQLDHVLLDISHKPAEQIQQLFPMIYSKCLEFGFDITAQAIPVVPAAHYTCGGVLTNHAAQTDIDHLYAIGEVAYTGLHGANRMASNSLLECLVFASSASEAILQQLKKPLLIQPDFKEILMQTENPGLNSTKINGNLNVLPLLNDYTLQLRQMMSIHLGVIRSNSHLATAQQKLNLFTQAFNKINRNQLNGEFLRAWYALRNRLQVASLMIASATQRKESRGCHFNTDFPLQHSHPSPTILIPTSVSTMVKYW